MRFALILILAVSAALAADKKAIQPEGFPAGGPFSPGIMSGGTLYVAGQVGRDLKTQKIPTEFEAEVKLAIENIGLILKAAGMDYSNCVSVTVYMADMDLFARMNTVYMKYFPEPRPARATVGVAKLAGGAHLEISAIAR